MSMGFARQEYCNGLTFPSPGDLLNPGVETPLLHCQIDSLSLSHLASLPKQIQVTYMVLKAGSFHNPVMAKDDVQL